MPYLTYEEYSELSDLDKKREEFEETIKKATVVLDNVTGNFYQFVDIAEDKAVFRREQFKKALSAQVDFFLLVGTTDFRKINNQPYAVNIGATAITNADLRKSEDGNNYQSIVADEVYLYLEGTGLLYRGV